MTKRVVRVKGGRGVHSSRPLATNDRQSATGHLRAVHLGEGVPPLTTMVEELQDMTDVLLGRVKPPIDAGHLTLYEVADAYYARAAEITFLLQQAEREGTITKGSAHYKFRTGELRTFLEMAKRAADLGSRRITYEQMMLEAAMSGRDSKLGMGNG
jgi:hypothetical protein